MLKKVLISFGVLVCTIICVSYNTNVAHTNTTAAPAGYTGSPNDGKTCSTNGGCHSGTPTPVTGWITSNIPSTGYDANAGVYTLTVTATDMSKSKFGFSMTSRNSVGAAPSLGTITVGQTQLNGSGNSYITHTSAGTTGTNGTKTWLVKWNPNTSFGQVTFYASFVCANADGSNSGDNIYTTSLIVQEAPTITSIRKEETENSLFSVYPNPISDESFIKFNLTENTNVIIDLFDLSGRLVKNLFSDQRMAGEHLVKLDVANNNLSGIYFIKTTIGEKQAIKKVSLL